MPRALNLRDMDLNLLVALDALLQEPNVTKAATRIGMTQPALSHALRRLRELLGDELLVCGKAGMLLTPRGRELALPVRRAMLDLQQALAGEQRFEPATATRRVTLATTDYEGVVLLPRLLELLRHQAPGVELEVRHIDPRHYAEQLETGMVDLLVGFPLPAASGLRQRVLFKEVLACVVRKDHPAVRGRLDLNLYCQLAHALISPRSESGSLVDDTLAGLGRTRRVTLRLPSFIVAPLLVAGSDLVLTLPRRLADSLAGLLPLQVLEPPIEIPSFPIVMNWHERYDGDAAHRWLRQLLVRAVGAPGEGLQE